MAAAIVTQNSTEEILNVPYNQVIPDPEVPNIRGPIYNTVTLQRTIEQAPGGIEQALWVRRLEDGRYGIIDGYRRWTAAGVLGIKTLPVVVKDVGPEGVRRLMLLANMSEALPAIVLDKEGNVIGGECEAAFRLVNDEGRKRYEVAEWMGQTADVVGAYCMLYQDSVAMKQRVEKGDIAITVYSLLKRQSDAFKAYILSKRGDITARVVRKALREWDDIQQRQQEEVEESEEDLDVEDDPEEDEQEDRLEEHPVVYCLNKALDWLRAVGDRPLSPTDRHTYSRLKRALDELEDNQ